jgi:DNA-binding GntR family transcriptional regulator
VLRGGQPLLGGAAATPERSNARPARERRERYRRPTCMSRVSTVVWMWYTTCVKPKTKTRSKAQMAARVHAGSSHKLVNPPLLGERVYQQLRSDIIRGVFQQGDAINEKVLASRYEGSRTPVREAAMRLQQEGLLRIVPNKGYFVSHITIQDLNEMYEYRTELEGFCAELAARRWTDQLLLERLGKLALTKYKTSSRDSYEHFIETDTEFHVGIAVLGHNRLVARAVADVRSQMERIMFAAIDIGYYGEFPTIEHEEIVEAIRRRDGSTARRLMSQHIVGSKEKVLSLAGRSR